jgi:hypothetical protein
MSEGEELLARLADLRDVQEEQEDLRYPPSEVVLQIRAEVEKARSQLRHIGIEPPYHLLDF